MLTDTEKAAERYGNVPAAFLSGDGMPVYRNEAFARFFPDACKARLVTPDALEKLPPSGSAVYLPVVSRVCFVFPWEPEGIPLYAVFPMNEDAGRVAECFREEETLCFSHERLARCFEREDEPDDRDRLWIIQRLRKTERLCVELFGRGKKDRHPYRGDGLLTLFASLYDNLSSEGMLLLPRLTVKPCTKKEAYLRMAPDDCLLSLFTLAKILSDAGAQTVSLFLRSEGEGTTVGLSGMTGRTGAFMHGTFGRSDFGGIPGVSSVPLLFAGTMAARAGASLSATVKRDGEVCFSACFGLPDVGLLGIKTRDLPSFSASELCRMLRVLF